MMAAYLSPIIYLCRSERERQKICTMCNYRSYLGVQTWRHEMSHTIKTKKKNILAIAHRVWYAREY